MTDIAQGNSTQVVVEEQSAVGVPATTTDGKIILVRPSQGLNLAVQTVESQILDRSGMKRRPRLGSQNATAAYDSELLVGNFDPVFKGVLGFEDPADSLSEADLTSVTITGTGTTLTMGGGDLIALGLYAGRLIRFGTLATSGNNGVWVPILAVDNTAKTVTVPSGYLVDEAIDSAFTLDLAKTFYTPNPRPKKYITVEEYLDIDRSKLGTDMRYNGLNFNAAANQMIQAGFTLGGLDMQPQDAGDSPYFTAPDDAAIAGAQSMTMLDGDVYVNGVSVLNLTSLTAGLSANSQITPLLLQRVGLGVGVPSFTFAGNIGGVVTDFDAWDKFRAETQLSIQVMMRQAQALSSDCVSLYIGDAAYAPPQYPIADGDSPFTAPLYAGLDTRGVANGYQRSVMVISTSAP